MRAPGWYRLIRHASGLVSQLAKHRRHRRPRRSGIGIVYIVAIAGAVGDPADPAAICHRHRHLMAARRHHVAKRCRSRDDAQRRDHIGFDRQCESTQQDGALRDRFLRGPQVGSTFK
jgi:hypothetical protein